MKFIKTSFIAAVFITAIVSLLWLIKPFNNNAITGEQAWQLQLKEKRAKKIAGQAKLDQPDKFQLFHSGIRTRENEDRPGYAPNYRFTELNKYKRKASARTESEANGVIEYIERGPANVPGRTRGLLVLSGDPDKNTWLAGASGGGIWKTSDGGQTWTNKSPDLPSLAVTSLAMSESNADIIYAGTGEYIASAGTAIEGDGVFKSEDGGETWTQLSATGNNPDFISITRVIVSPNDPNVLLACSAPNTWDNVFRSGIMKSVDGGSSWTKVYEASSNNAVEQLVFDPNDFNIQYATQNGIGVLKSTDAGDSWTLSNSGMSVSGRVEIAISPSNTNRIFASTQGGLTGTNSDLYVSDDAAGTWNLVEVNFNGNAVDFLGGQGWYDNTIVCDPFNEDIVYFGGVELFRLEIGDQTSSTGFYDLENSASFVDFINFGAEAVGGILAIGPNANQNKIDIRFGSGQSQKAHRFTVPSDGGSNGNGGPGVPASDYSYQDYIDVPFEVWEIDENGNDVRQLMVSFRDQENNNVFNLNARSASDPDLLTAREYIYINDIVYSDAPDNNIMTNGGHEYNHIYFLWPILADNATWEPNSLPESEINIFFNELSLRSAATLPVADVYGRYNARNAYIVNGEDVHPDQHNTVAIVMDETAKTYKILLSNDGGVFISNTSTAPGTQEGDWTFAGQTYNTSQFYGADKMPGADRYLGGMQDNGTWVSPSGTSASAESNYSFSIGGDGFEVIWHSLEPNKLIGGSQNNNFRRSTDGGSSWTNATAGLTGSFPFISKLATSKNLPDYIYTVSSEGVFISDNFGASWSLSPITTKWGGASTFLDVEVSRANANVIWAGSGMTSERSLHVSTDRGNTFSETSNFTDVTFGSITRLASHPINENIAYALFSFANGPKILKTEDLGQTWTDISGFGTNETSNNGFPDVAVYCLYVRPDNPNIIWVGSEIGIIESLDNGATWNVLDEFPNVSVWDLKGQDNQIVIATHGRGIWTANLEQNQNNAIDAIKITKVGFTPQNQLNIVFDVPEGYDSLSVSISGNEVGKKNDLVTGTNTILIDNPGSGVYALNTLGYLDGAPYQSGAFEFQSITIPSPQNSFSTDFSSGSINFFGAGLSLSSFDGNRSLQSNHNYLDNEESTSLLIVPIIVNDEYSLMTYEDIAIVEPQNDFVAVEATLNGLDWITLAKYDASKNSNWTQAYNNNETIDQSLYVDQSIDLLDQFSNGDEILVRFRLKSNENINGWGWSIDNLYIQEEPTSVHKEIAIQKTNLFPNPSEGKFTIINSSFVNKKISGKLFNYNGQEVRTYNLQANEKGEISLSEYLLKPGIYYLSINNGDNIGESIRLIIN